MSMAITVQVRPGMNLPLPNGGYVEEGKTATIEDEYLPQIVHFIEQVPQMGEEGGKAKK